MTRLIAIRNASLGFAALLLSSLGIQNIAVGQDDFLGSSSFLEVVDQFEDVKDITNSSNIAKVRTLAALADMSTADFANFAIKRLVIQQGIMEQPVVIEINNRSVELKHPHASVNEGSSGQLVLRYSDFLVDRSGPKFLGALNADVAVETLLAKDAQLKALLTRLNDGRSEVDSFHTDVVAQARGLALARLGYLAKGRNGKYMTVRGFEDFAKANTLQERTEAKYLTAKQARSWIKVDVVTSLFLQKHLAQRRLSDFDLTARETTTLSKAIGNAIWADLDGAPAMETPAGQQLMMEIGRIAWELGGPIDTRKIEKALKTAEKAQKKSNTAKSAARFYLEDISDPKEKEYHSGNGKAYYHMLTKEIGPIVKKLLRDSRPEVDAYYGLGIPFMAPEVEEYAGKLRFRNEKDEDGELAREEIGDVICDSTSHYAAVFSHDKNISRTLQRLKQTKITVKDQNRNLRENFTLWLADNAPAELQPNGQYTKDAAFIDTILMFEQIAKKESQSQIFKREKKTEKLIGNISDTGQFMSGAAGTSNAVLYQDVVKLSCLIAMPRWGIDATNVRQVLNTDQGVVTAATFAASINKRSYTHMPIEFYMDGNVRKPLTDIYSPRVHLEWSLITEKIAEQRIREYRASMLPVWTFLHTQTDYFGKVSALMKVISKKDDSSKGRYARQQARKAVGDSLKAIVRSQLTTLMGKIPAEDQAEFYESITAQAEQTASFQLLRAQRAAEKAASGGN
jgi:hypothetical protein